MRTVLTVASNYGRFLVGMAAVAVVTPAAIAALGIDRFGLWALAAATCGFIALLELGIATTSIGQGRKAAESIHATLRGEEPKGEPQRPLVGPEKIKMEHYEAKQHLRRRRDATATLRNDWHAWV